MSTHILPAWLLRLRKLTSILSLEDVTNPAKFMAGVQRAACSCENVLGGFSTPEGFGVFIMLRQIVIDRGLQVVGAGITATSDAPRRYLGEEGLHEVQPIRAGG